jgi:hypothetical protein
MEKKKPGVVGGRNTWVSFSFSQEEVKIKRRM